MPSLFIGGGGGGGRGECLLGGYGTRWDFSILVLSLSLSPFCKISMCELRFISAGFFFKE